MSALRVGYGEADITPRTPTQLSGFASRAGLASGALDPLTGRALWLESGGTNVCLLALDLLGVPDGFGPRLRETIGAGAPELIVCATHTHAGPPVLERSMLGAPPPGYVASLSRRCAEAVDAARADARAVEVRRALAPTRGIAHNRRDPAGPVDPDADVLIFAPVDGGPEAIWMNFACHPVVLGPDNPRYSADFPGAARRRIEAARGARVLYTTGCAGEINLGHSALDSIRRIGLDKRTPAEAERIGAVLADAVLAAIAADARPIIVNAPAARATTLPAMIAPPDEAARAAIAAAARAILDDPAASPGERAMADIDRAFLAAPRPSIPDLPVAALALGPLRAAFLPGEIFVETALALKRRAPGAIVIGYANSNPGYIPPAGARGGYEVDVAWRPYGAPGPFAPGMAEALADAALGLF